MNEQQLRERYLTKAIGILHCLSTGNENKSEQCIQTCLQLARKFTLIEPANTPKFLFQTFRTSVENFDDIQIILQKESAQAAFECLKGRRLKNPYRATDATMGPLMRDVKKKICRDCDLQSLLEDDVGIELLVDGKIISLDLPVADVYKKIWQPQHSGEPMLIVYRMRCLLGDATEELVSLESLDSKKDDKVKKEEIYTVSRVVGGCGGLEITVENLHPMKNLQLTSIRNVVDVDTMLLILISLFEIYVDVQENRIRLLDLKLNSIAMLIALFKQALASNKAEVVGMAAKTLTIINRLLTDCESATEDQFQAFCASASASDEDFRWLLAQIHNPQVQASTTLKDILMQTIANLTLGSDRRTSLLVEFFKPALNFDNYEIDASVKSTTELDVFCILSCHISPNKYGSKVQDTFIETSFVKTAINFLTSRCPPLFKIGLTIDSPDWKEFLARPSLKFILRLLAGLCKFHESTQLLVAEDCVPIIHRLEQISSEERLGSLAEILMEALKSNPKVARKIEEVREETKLWRPW